MPTHVHKWGCLPYKDCIELGSWHEGATGQVGLWVAHSSTPSPVVIDQGAAYASKDMWDSEKKRRLSIAWARLQPATQGSQVNGDVQTLAREVTYHPGLEQLLFSPLKEQAALRGSQLSSVHNKMISIDQSLTLGPFPHGNQSEVQIFINIPNKQATLYVTVEAEVRIKFYVDFKGFAPTGSSNPKVVPAPFHEVEVGMLTDDPYSSIKDTLRLLDDEEVLELRLFLDHTITEAYWQGGRVAMTASSPLTASTSITLSTDTPGAELQVQNISAWEMGSAWISEQAALQATITA
jgi:sucrose-6-phosphate hydrolase SacC (GH32 family)